VGVDAAAGKNGSCIVTSSSGVEVASSETEGLAICSVSGGLSNDNESAFHQHSF
jgi:hypothetical protein